MRAVMPGATAAAMGAFGGHCVLHPGKPEIVSPRSIRRADADMDRNNSAYVEQAPAAGIGCLDRFTPFSRDGRWETSCGPPPACIPMRRAAR